VLDFEAIEAVYAAAAPGRCGKCELTTDVLDNVLGLVIAEPVLTP
jgi:hypothetical protein